MSEITKITESLKASGGVALAFSGGTDSSALLQLLLRQNVDVLAMHFTGPHLDSAHSRETVAWLETRKIPYKVVSANPLGIPEVRASHPRRCYFCKLNAFSRLQRQAGGRTLCDGTNAGDIGGYRPGLEALRELGVRSPFAEAGLAKPQIRELAVRLGIELPPSGGQNCLLTRFAYGLEVSEEQIRAVENAETEIRQLLGMLKPMNFRLRCLQDGRPELHVESPAALPGALHDRLAALLADHGLSAASIVAMDKISGFFDRKVG